MTASIAALLLSIVAAAPAPREQPRTPPAARAQVARADTGPGAPPRLTRPAR